MKRQYQDGLVSIIIPAYNAEEYLKGSIMSCIKQDYDRLEIIVVDDGSTDNTAKIAKGFLDSDKIKYHYQKNAGGAAARNTGIKLAQGEYLLFLDADDELMPGVVSKMVRKITKNKADFCIGNYIEVRQDTGTEKPIDIIKEDKVIVDDNIAVAFTYPPCPTTKLFKKRIIDENNITFADVKISQDLNFAYKYILCCKKIVTMKDYIYKYKVVHGSISHSYDLRILDILKSFDDVEDFATKRGLKGFYDKYIINAKLGHISYQIRKIWRFNDMVAQKKAIKEFKKQYEQLSMCKDVVTYAPYKMDYVKGKLCLLFSGIYISRAAKKLLGALSGR